MKHGTRYCYQDGCRCDACREAQSQYHRDYMERKQNAATRPYVEYTGSSEPEAPTGAGPVELAVQVEIGAAADLRPGLAAATLAMARVLDNPRAVNQHASAAKVMAMLLDKLEKVGAPARRGHLAAVRTMTTKDGA